MRYIPRFGCKGWGRAGRVSDACFKEPVAEAAIVEGELVDLGGVECAALEGGEFGGELGAVHGGGVEGFDFGAGGGGELGRGRGATGRAGKGHAPETAGEAVAKGLWRGTWCGREVFAG